MIEVKLERFFLVRHVRRGGHVGAMEILELFAAGFAVFLFLIVVGKTHGAPFAIVNGHYVFEREFSALGYSAGEFLDGGMHHASKSHGGARAAANAPHLFEQILHGAFAVTLDGGRAEWQRFGYRRVVGFGPERDAGVSARVFILPYVGRK